MPSKPQSPAFAIIVMGVSGCGKSTLGSLLAKSLDCPFLEGDTFHSRPAIEKMSRGEALNDEDRWPWLERLGAATALAIADHGVAVAACSALRKAYRDRLRQTIGSPLQLILLENCRNRLVERLTSRGGHFMPPSLIDSQLATLEHPCPDEGALTLLTEDPPASLRDRVLAHLALRGLRA